MNQYNINSDRKYAKIFKIGINSTTIDEVLTFVEQKISKNENFYIVTPNPEMILIAKNDMKFARLVNEADVSIPDGVGIKWAAKFLDGTSINIIPGRKLFMELIKLADSNSWKVFLVGTRSNEVMYKVKKILEEQFKKVKIEVSKGPELNKNGIPISEEDRNMQKIVASRIKMFQPHLVFVGFGAPRQESWMENNFYKLSSIGMMGVGGTFDYIAGVIKLPPQWMEKLGLEWLSRLIQEPKRIKRILNATVAFPLSVIKYKFTK